MRASALVKVFELVFLFAVIAGSACAQTQAPAPTRDPQAMAVLQSAIAAMGGPSAISAIQDATVQGTLQNATGAAGQTIGFIWRTAGSEFRQEIQTNGATTRIYVSGHGSPRDLRRGTWVSLPYHESRAVLPYQLPAVVLLSELNSPNYTISYVGPVTINGNSVIQVHTCDESDFISHLVLPQEWYFDPASGLPVQVDFKIPSDTAANDPRSGSIQFSNFKIVNGIAVPFQLSLQEGSGSATAIVSSVQFNSSIPASDFDPPSGGAQ